MWTVEEDSQVVPDVKKEVIMDMLKREGSVLGVAASAAMVSSYASGPYSGWDEVGNPVFTSSNTARGHLSLYTVYTASVAIALKGAADVM